ncbi:TonB-dependent receptor [Neptunitalea chrysea]|uniref:TonB-dependent receptor n=1 Tax=Neptunitalea chrysea TaxID=1647581 RepID=A0A9W6B818_9FLAO|nr:TonB-dependent receptor [Neptunitalea chrysea]GLB52498.1 TonB-dependent receptor [Neptunitalea chrysea]
MKLLFTTLCFLSVVIGFGQQKAILSCTVTVEDNEPLPYGTLQLTQEGTTSPVYFTIIDGKVSTEELPLGTYQLFIATLGYKDYTETITLNRTTQKSIVLTIDVTQLEGVTVTSAQKSMTYKNGILSVNVANSVLANMSATTDVIGKLPGVIVSADKESINVLGKGSPILYLGHQRITIEQLNSIPVNAIEKIELLKNPSVKYEADGNAVLVITLKKNNDKGYQIQLKEDASQQHNFNNYLSGNAYVGLGKMSMQLSLGYNQLQHWESNTSKLRYVAEGFTNEYVVLSDGNRAQVPGSVGVSYNLNETDYISTQTSFMIHRDPSPIYSQTNITDNGVTTFYDNYSSNKSNRDYISTNLNYYKKLTAKTGLFTGAQYTYKKRESNSNVYDVTIPNTVSLTAQNIQKSNIEVFSAKADVEVALNEKTQWESGVNLYLAETTSQSSNRNETTPDYLYKEHTYAAYSQLKGEVKKISFTAGLRLEHNTRNGSYIETGETEVDNTNTYLFPRVHTTWEIDSVNSVSVSYNKSISRPSFSQANNAKVYINEYLDFVNNVNLQPSIRDEVGVEYKRGKKGLHFVAYRATNTVYYLTNYDTDSEKLQIGATNVTSENGYQLILMLPFSHKIWNSTNYLYGGLVDVNNVNAQHMGATPYFYYYTDNELKFKKDFTIGVNYFYMMKHEEGVRTSAGFSSLGINASKKFNKHWTCFLYANDVFNTLKFTQAYTTNGIDSKTTYFTDNHGVGLSVTYTFGKLVKKNFKNKNVDEQLDRVK